MDLLKMFPGLKLNELNIIPYEARFTSNVAGSVNHGFITWDNILSDAHDALSSTMYFLASASYNVNLDQDDLLNALDRNFNNGFLGLDIISQDDKEVLNKSKINFANYVNDRQLGVSYQVRRSNQPNQRQKIQFRVKGQVKQTNAIVAHLSDIGETTLDLYVNAVIVGVNNQQWIEKYFLQG
jgi:hypothetical protein